MEGTCDHNSYRKKAEEVAATLQQYYKDTSGWIVSKKSKHFVISYRKSSEFEGYIYKGEAVINAKPKVVFDYVEPLPDGKRAQWDKNMKKIEVIQRIDDDLRINRVCTASACMGLISPRDFVDLIIIKNTDECLSTNAISIACDACPVDSRHVRGQNYSCGMIVCKYPNNKCCWCSCGTEEVCTRLELSVWYPSLSYFKHWNIQRSRGRWIAVFDRLLQQCFSARGIEDLLMFDTYEPKKCKLVSLVQPDIKGMLPRHLVDTAIPGSMTEFFTAIRAALKEDGELDDDE